MTSLTQLNLLIEKVQHTLAQLEKKIDRLVEAKSLASEEIDRTEAQDDYRNRYQELCRKLRQLTEEFDDR